MLTVIRELTPCKRKVLKLVANGLTTREIADKLCRSEKTIEAQRTLIIRELNLKGNSCLIRFAATYTAYL